MNIGAFAILSRVGRGIHSLAGYGRASPLGGAALVHWVVKEARRINEELDNAKRVKVRVTDQERRPTLRLDPRTGEYRP